jgi:acetolactate synthase-1/2/3 large subunit
VTLPDIKRVAFSYDLRYHRLDNQKDIVENVRNILETPGPAICEVMMYHTHESLPRNSTYKKEDGTFVSLPMEDLLPLLPREEFEENMSVSKDD